MSNQTEHTAGKDVIIALDFPGKSDALAFLDRFPDADRLFVKIGMELFYAAGPDIVREIKKRGHRVFLDLKLHDIPTTVQRTAAVLSGLGADMVNVHASGGVRMMCAALEGLHSGEIPNHTELSGASGTGPSVSGTGPLLIAVTQLTSTDERMLKEELLIDTPMTQTVLTYARNASRAGLHGVVCSPWEAAVIKQHCGSGFVTVTPGIRFADSVADDQKRIMTPERAGESGCDYIVVGRPVTQSPDPVSTWRRCVRDFTGKEV